MKVLIYFQDRKAIQSSGIGHAEMHQLSALKETGVEYTLNPLDSFDVAHINTVWHKSHQVLRNCRKRGIPVIVHGHSTHEDFRNSFFGWKIWEPFVDKALDYMYGHADLIITPTPYSKSLIESYKGVTCPVLAISNGIQLSEYAKDEESCRLFREKYGIKEGEKFVMGVGFPFKRKGLDDFIEVARKFPDTKFIWFGHLMDIAVSPYIKRVIRHRPKNCIFPGYAKGKYIRGAYQSASVFFFPSNEETEGIVVLEAMASHTPMVLRNIGAYRPWLQDGVNAHLETNNEEFEKEIRNILDHGDDPKILDAAYKAAEERDLSKIGPQLKAAYEQAYALKKKSE